MKEVYTSLEKKISDLNERLEKTENIAEKLNALSERMDSGKSIKKALQEYKHSLGIEDGDKNHPNRDEYERMRRFIKKKDINEVEKEYSSKKEGFQELKKAANEILAELYFLNERIELKRSEGKSEDSEDKSNIDAKNPNQPNEYNEERINFIKDQSQKTEATMNEKDKDSKLNALKYLDDAKRNGDEIPKEILEKVYNVFDIQNNPERKKAIDEFAKEKPIEINQNTRSVEKSQEISQNTRQVDLPQEINSNKNSDYSASMNVGTATKIQNITSNPYPSESGESKAFNTGLSDFNSSELLNMNRHLLPALQKIEKAQKILEVANLSKGKELLIERGQNSRNSFVQSL